MGLGYVFKEDEAMVLGEGLEGFGGHHLAVEMDGDNGAGAGGEGGGGLVEIHEGGGPIAVYEDGLASGLFDPQEGGNKGIGGNEHFVTGLEATGFKTEGDRGGAAGYPSAPVPLAIAGEVLLKGLDSLTEDEVTPIEDVVEGS